MKMSKILTAAGTLFLLLLSSACVMYPQPLENANAASLPEVLPYFGDWFIFEEKSDPVRVKVVTYSQDVMLGNSITNQIERNISKYNAMIQKGNEPYEMTVVSDIKFSELTPPPACRMSGSISFAVNSQNSEQLVLPFDYNIELQKAFDTQEKAKSYLASCFYKPTDSWLSDHFSVLVTRQVGAAVLRFRTSRDLIEWDPTEFETDVREILNLLRKIKGIRSVRLIESGKGERLASYRVFYDRERFPNGLTEKINKAK